MSKLSAHALRRFYGLLKEANLMHEKESILSGYGVASAKDLTPAQMDEVCQGLIDAAAKKPRTAASPEVRRWRSVCLDLLTSMGIYRDKTSWPAVNNFLKQPRIAGKMLYEMDVTELKKLSRKLRLLAAKKQNKAQEDTFLATNN